MQKLVKTICLLIVGILCLPFFSTFVFAQEANEDSSVILQTADEQPVITGWHEDASNVWHFYDDQGNQVEKPKGFYHIGEKYYYLTAKGTRIEKPKGWYVIGGRYYYLTAKGTRIEKPKGFYFIDGRWIYLRDSGSRVVKNTGWYKMNGSYYYIRKSGEFYTGFKTIGGKKYYLNKKGGMKNGWIRVSKTYYYQLYGKGISTCDVIKDRADGKYYYVDENGKRINNRLTKYLVKIWRSESAKGMTKEEKLYAFYMYFATEKAKNKHFVYDRRYDDYLYVGKTGWTEDYAYQMLSQGKGNCYRFACSFAYMAKMLGYNVYVQAGQVTAARGGYTPHSWVEFRNSKGDVAYICDPELQFAGGWKLYKKTYKNYPLTLIKGKAYRIKW